MHPEYSCTDRQDRRLLFQSFRLNLGDKGKFQGKNVLLKTPFDGSWTDFPTINIPDLLLFDSSMKQNLACEMLKM